MQHRLLGLGPDVEARHLALPLPVILLFLSWVKMLKKLSAQSLDTGGYISRRFEKEYLVAPKNPLIALLANDSGGYQRYIAEICARHVLCRHAWPLSKLEGFRYMF